MRKLVLAILKDLTEQSEIDRIFKKLEMHEYEIHLFNDYKGEIQLDSLPILLDYIGVDSNISKVVVVSNIRSLILAWYRCYNHLVDDYILFINPDDHLRQHRFENQQIIDALAKFENLQYETLEGKIYLNLDVDNHHLITPFLIENNRFIYFDSLSYFSFEERTKKQKVKKVYLLGSNEITFDDNQYTVVEKISLNTSCNNTILINEAFINNLVENSYFALFALILISKINIDFSTKAQIALKYFEEMSKRIDKNILFNKILDYIRLGKSTYHEQVYLLSSCVKLGIKNGLLKEIIQTMVEDTDFIEHHYPLLMSSLFYHSTEGIDLYPELYNDRIKIISKIKEFYENQLVIIPNKRKKNRIALITGQLLSLSHAPTMAAFQFVKAIKNYLPEYEIVIFVDDMFAYSPNEIMHPLVYSSTVSSTLYNIHEKELEGLNTTIHYSNPKLNRKNRIQNDINAIIDFEPTILLVLGSDYSIPVALLYKYFPVMTVSMAGPENSEFADLYTGKWSVDMTLKEYNYYNISDRNYRKITFGIDEFPSPKKVVYRNEYNLNEEDFVLVTVGNRLAAEMDEEFIDMICEFINRNTNTKWLVVGPTRPQYLNDRYNLLIESERIIFVNYESDLAALYKICDVYVNPFRIGGGNSGYVAMVMFKPVVSLQGYGDVSAVIGDDFTFKKEDYLQEINRLHFDEKYRLEKGRIMRKISEGFTLERTASDLAKYFEITIQMFENRKIINCTI